jgi:hypothetical protein
MERFVYWYCVEKESWTATSRTPRGDGGSVIARSEATWQSRIRMDRFSRQGSTCGDGGDRHCERVLECGNPEFQMNRFAKVLWRRKKWTPAYAGEEEKEERKKMRKSESLREGVFDDEAIQDYRDGRKNTFCIFIKMLYI